MLQVGPFEARHLPDAVALVCSRYTSLRRAVPLLPPRYEEPGELEPRLRDMLRRAPGAVAHSDGRLVGFLTGYLLERFRGRPGVFCPEWAHSAEPGRSRAIYEALYTYQSHHWVAAGYTAHALSLLADDAEASEGLRWLGFGLAAADAVRGLAPINAPATGLAIRRAGPADLSSLVALDEGLRRHLTGAPIFLPLGEPGDPVELAAELADPATAFWSAWSGAESVGYMKFGPATDQACAVIRDSGTTSITGAYTLPELRGRGVAAALLDRGLAWARAEGYTRCAVDFEPMNTVAARFWSAHFQIIGLSHLRLVERPARG